MIFTSLGLLVVAAGFLIAGITKSSVALLVLSLVATVAAGVVLAVAYSAARRASLAPGVVPATPAPAIGAPPGAPNTAVVMYVPVDQLPAMAPAAAAVRTAVGNPPGGANGAVSPNGAVPVAGYDDMTVEQVGKLIASGALSAAQLEALRDYETSHAARKRVLDRLDRTLRRQ